jgi:hypothetical protein
MGHVDGNDDGIGYGVYGYSDSGNGVNGYSKDGDGVHGTSNTLSGVYGFRHLATLEAEETEDTEE